MSRPSDADLAALPTVEFAGGQVGLATIVRKLVAVAKSLETDRCTHSNCAHGCRVISGFAHLTTLIAIGRVKERIGAKGAALGQPRWAIGLAHGLDAYLSRIALFATAAAVVRVDLLVDAGVAAWFQSGGAAGEDYLGEDAAATWIAGILGALAAIIAVEVSAADTLAQVAMIVGCTQILVVAGSVVQLVRASENRRAGVIRADVLVVAIQGRTSFAVALEALVVFGAEVAVVARCLVPCVHTSDSLLT